MLGRSVIGRRFQIGNGVLAAAEQGALVTGGQEATGEAIQAPGRNEAAFENDEAGEVFADAAEPVVHPGAHTGAALEAGAGVHEVVSGGVFRVVGDHGADDA